MNPGRRRWAGVDRAAFGTASLPTQQLAEFLALISCFNDERTATRKGIEHVAEVLDAEVAALVRGGAVIAAVGFAEGEVPIELLGGGGRREQACARRAGRRGMRGRLGAARGRPAAAPGRGSPRRRAVPGRGARPAAWNGPGPDPWPAQFEAAGERACPALGLRAPGERERPLARGAARTPGAAGATRPAAAGNRRSSARPRGAGGRASRAPASCSGTRSGSCASPIPTIHPIPRWSPRSAPTGSCSPSAAISRLARAWAGARCVSVASSSLIWLAGWHRRREPTTSQPTR